MDYSIFDTLFFIDLFFIYSAEDVLIEGRLSALVKTDIAVKVPEGTYGRLCSRSGLALNFGIDIAGNSYDALMMYNSDIMMIIKMSYF